MTDRQHEEIRELLGAFALDAVEADERALVEAHLGSCRQCRLEVDQHRRTMSALVPPGVDPPEGLWEQIASSLEEEAPTTALIVSPRLARRRWTTAAVALAAAASVVAVGLLGLQVAEQQREIARLSAALEEDALQRSARAALADPDALTAILTTPEGEAVAQVVLLPSGQGFLIPHDLPPLGEDRSYQLWVVADEEVISAGVLGPSPQVVPFAWNGPVEAFVLTREEAGGAATSAGDVAATADAS